MSGRLSEPLDRTHAGPPAALLNCANAAPHGTAAAALDRDGLTEGRCSARQSSRNAKGAASPPPDPQAAASGGLAVLPWWVSVGDSSGK
jgi:hypothetical protein